jgi:UDP-glucose 4-epimerase
MRVLISGGAGFIGSHLVDAALAEGWRVGVLDDLSTGRRERVAAEAELFEIDLRDRAAVDACVRTFAPDVIDHHAAQASVAVSMRAPLDDAAVNVIGGLHLLEAARRYGVERFVYGNTGGALYGEVAEGQVAALDRLPQPISPYAVSKLAFEHYLSCYALQYGLEVASLRYANIYGPRQDPHGEAGVVAIFIDRLLREQPLTVNARSHEGDDGCIRDYLLVDDVVAVNVAACRGEVTGVLDVGSGVGTTTRGLAEQLLGVAAQRGLTSDLRFGPPRPGDIGRSVLSSEALTRRGIVVTPLGRGLEQTFDWFLDRRGAP